MAVAGDAWVEHWLSAARFATYLAATGGDRARALRLYEWNVRVSGALFHDLAHLEIALRNAYDRALRTAGGPVWTDPASNVFASPPGSRAGRPDAHEVFRRQIAEARVNAGRACRTHPAHGDVVAQLPFGFWRYLSAKAHEKTLWVPYLHRAFAPGTDRRAHVDDPIGRLHKVRNRIAHHEPLLRVDLLKRCADVVAVAGRIDGAIGRYVAAGSDVGRLVAARP